MMAEMSPYWSASLPDHILDFPEEILILIIQYAASTPWELVKLSHVCSLFNMLSQQRPFCWQFCPIIFEKKLKNDSGNGICGKCSSLLEKYFDENSPLSVKNLKYKNLFQNFEAEFMRQEESRRMKENQKKLLKKSYQLPAVRKPLLVSKVQFIEQLKYLNKNEKKYERMQRVRGIFEKLKPALEVYFGTSTIIIAYTFLLFIQCGLCGLHLTSYLPFDTNPNIIFYPVKLFVANMCLFLIISLTRELFQKRSESVLPFILMMWVALICFFFYANTVQHRIVEGILAHDSTAGYVSIFSSWYMIMLFPIVLIVIFTAMYYFFEIHNHIQSYIPLVFKIKIHKRDIMLLSLLLSLVIQLLLIAAYLEGVSISMWIVFSPAYIQEIMWLIFSLDFVQMKNFSVIISLILSLIWLQVLLSFGIYHSIVFTPILLVATSVLWIIIDKES